MSEKLFKISAIGRYQDNKPTQVELTWPEMVGKLSRHRKTGVVLSKHVSLKQWYLKYKNEIDDINAELKQKKTSGSAAEEIEELTEKLRIKREKRQFIKEEIDLYKNGEGFLACTFKKEGVRSADYVDKYYFLVIDSDDGCPFEEIQKMFEGFNFVLTSSISYDGTNNKCRVVLPLDKPLTKEDQSDLFDRIEAHAPSNFPGYEKNFRCFDHVGAKDVQLYFWPARLADVNPYVFIGEGRDLRFSDFELDEVKIAQRIVNSERKVAKLEEDRKKLRERGLDGKFTVTQGDKKLIRWADPTQTFVVGADELTLGQWRAKMKEEGTSKIVGVECPFHNDANGVEFIGLSNKNKDHIFFVCRKCGTFHLKDNEKNEDEDFKSALAKLKSKSTPKKVEKKLETTWPQGWEETVPGFIECTSMRKKKLGSPGRVLRKEFESRYLTEYVNDVKIINFGLMFIKSPKGTGKTEFLKQLQRPGRVLLIGHRVTLLHNLANRLGLAHYRDVFEEHDNVNNHDKLAICIDSLASIKNGNRNFSTVVIDESEQVICHLMSDTFKKTRGQVISAFQEIISNADRVICLDADLSEILTQDVIAGFRHKPILDDKIFIENTYKIGAGRKVEMFQTDAELVIELIENLNAGKKCYVATNTKEFCFKLQEIMSDALPKISGLYVNAETTTQQPVKDFIEDPTKECVNYDLVVTSPTLATGVSIDGNHFDQIYGFFSKQPLTYLECDQSISRVRNPAAPRKVWIIQGSRSYLMKWPPYLKLDVSQKAREKYEAKLKEFNTWNAKMKKRWADCGLTPIEDEEKWLTTLNEFFDELKRSDNIGNTPSWHKIMYDILKKEKLSRQNWNTGNLSLPPYDENLSLKDVFKTWLSDEDVKWAEIAARIEWVNRTGMVNKRRKFVEYNQENGYTVEEVPFDEERQKRGVGYLKALSDLVLNKLSADIVNSAVVTYQEAGEIRKVGKQKLKREDELKAKRAEIVDFLQVNPAELTVEQVKKVIKEKLIGKAWKLKSSLTDRAVLKDKDMLERKEKERLITDFRHRVSEADILKRLVQSIGYSDLQEFVDNVKKAIAEKKDFVISQEKMEGLVEEFELNFKVYNEFFKSQISPRSQDPGKAKKIWEATFGSRGLSTYSKQKGKGENRTRVTYLDLKDAETIVKSLEIFEMRQHSK
jgi:hypothetical protein